MLRWAGLCVLPDALIDGGEADNGLSAMLRKQKQKQNKMQFNSQRENIKIYRVN